MSKKTKIIVMVGLVVLLVSATIGVALAQESTQKNQPLVPPGKRLLARVAEILGVEEQKLIDAFAQARRELAQEALANRLDNLVEQGRLTPEQAKEIEQWLAERPEWLGPGLGLGGPGQGFCPGWGRRGLGRFPWAPGPRWSPPPTK